MIYLSSPDTPLPHLWSVKINMGSTNVFLAFGGSSNFRHIAGEHAKPGEALQLQYPLGTS